VDDPGQALHDARLRAAGFDPRSGRRAGAVAGWLRRRRGALAAGR
jgi:hypothetical protein